MKKPSKKECSASGKALATKKSNKIVKRVAAKALASCKTKKKK